MYKRTKENFDELSSADIAPPRHGTGHHPVDCLNAAPRVRRACAHVPPQCARIR